MTNDQLLQNIQARTNWTIPDHDRLEWVLGKLPPAFTYKTPSDRFVNVNIYMELIADGNFKFIVASVGLTTVWWQSFGTPLEAALKLLWELIEQGVIDARN